MFGFKIILVAKQYFWDKFQLLLVQVMSNEQIRNKWLNKKKYKYYVLSHWSKTRIMLLTLFALLFIKFFSHFFGVIEAFVVDEFLYKKLRIMHGMLNSKGPI